MFSSATRPPFMPGLSRNLVIVSGVLLLHAVALWALHTGLLRRAVEILVPVQLLAEFVEPPQPVAPPPPVVAPAVTLPRKAAAKPVAPTALPPPTLQPVPNAEPAPNAPTAVVSPPAPLPPITAPQAAAAVPATTGEVAAAPALLSVELPSSDADYLQNPKAPYPGISKRLGEQGTVGLRVLVGIDGSAQKVEVSRSSGYDRLDRAASAAALKWRYKPGRRGGVPEAMWTQTSVIFSLQE